MTGEEYRAIRKEMRLTQAELGVTLGMSQQAINRIENTRGPTKQQAAAILVLQAYQRLITALISQ
jgi:transcriptional regulator with XRE-family HTH domain